MADNANNPKRVKSIVKYLLEACGGPADGKSVTADTKAAARAAYDALLLVCDTVNVAKQLNRPLLRSDLDSTKRADGTRQPMGKRGK